MGNSKSLVGVAGALVSAWLLATGAAKAAPRVFTVDPSGVIKDMSASYVGFDAEDFATGADMNWMLTKGRAEFARYCRMTGQRCWRFGSMNRYSWRSEKITRLLHARRRSRDHEAFRRKLEAQPLKWWFKPEDYFSFCRELNIKVLGTFDVDFVYDQKSGRVLDVVNHPETYPLAAREAVAWVQWVKDHGYLDLVPVWEIGNEEYHSWDPTEYAKLVQLIIAETRKVDPEIKVSVQVFIRSKGGDPNVRYLLDQMKAAGPKEAKEWRSYQRWLSWSGDMLAALGDSAKDVAYASIHTYGGGPSSNANYNGLVSHEKLLRAFPVASRIRMIDTEWGEASRENLWIHRTFRTGALWGGKFALTMMAYPRLDYSAAHSLFGLGGALYWSNGNRWVEQYARNGRPIPAVDSSGEGKPRFDIGPFGPVTKLCNGLIDTHPYLLSAGADLGNMSSALYVQSARKLRLAEGKKDDAADAAKPSAPIKRDVQWLIATNKPKTSLSGLFINTRETPVTLRLASEQGRVRMGAARVETLTCQPDKLDIPEIPGQPKFWHVTDSRNRGQAVVTLPANSVTRIVVPLDKK